MLPFARLLYQPASAYPIGTWSSTGAATSPTLASLGAAPGDLLIAASSATPTVNGSSLTATSGGPCSYRVLSQADLAYGVTASDSLGMAFVIYRGDAKTPTYLAAADSSTGVIPAKTPNAKGFGWLVAFNANSGAAISAPTDFTKRVTNGRYTIFDRLVPPRVAYSGAITTNAPSSAFLYEPRSS